MSAITPQSRPMRGTFEFWNHVDKQENGCWLWTGPMAPDRDCGLASYEGVREKAARVAYRIMHPDVDIEGVSIRRTCRNPLCVSPEHAKLRSMTITQTTVDEVCRRWAEGQSSPEIAQALALSDSRVRHLVRENATPEQCEAHNQRANYRTFRKKGEHVTGPETFWAKVDKGGAGGCWLWTGAKIEDGTGIYCYRSSRNRAVHRIAWELTHGIPEPKVNLRRKCANPACCNPAHYKLTYPGSKMGPGDHDKLLEMHRAGKSSREMAEAFGLTRARVNALLNAILYPQVPVQATKYVRVSAS